MKDVLLVTIITFIISCLLALFSGVQFFDMLFRATISTVSVLVLGTILVFSIKKYLFGISTKDFPHQVRSSTDEDLSVSNPHPEMQTSQDEEIGRKIDVRLDEESVSKDNGEILNDGNSVNNSDLQNGQVMDNSVVRFKKSNNGMTGDENVFLETNPDILAKMIRTRLSDED